MSDALSDTLKLCTGCKHFLAAKRDCEHPINMQKSPVDGIPKPANSPDYLRGPIGPCGPIARYWENK